MITCRGSSVLGFLLLFLLLSPVLAIAKPRQHAITKIGWAIQNCKKAMDAGIEAATISDHESWLLYKDQAFRMDPSLKTWSGIARGFQVNEWIPKCDAFFKKVARKIRITQATQAEAEKKKRKCPFLSREIKEAGLGPDYDYKTCRAKKENYGRIEKDPSAKNYRRAMRDWVLDLPKPGWQPDYGQTGEVLMVCCVKGDNLIQPRVGRRWGRLSWGGYSATARNLQNCKFPKPQKRWKKILKAARKAAYRIDPGTVIVVEPGDNWGYKRNAFGRIIRRELSVLVYQRKCKFHPRCRSKNPFAVCAASRSLTAKDADHATLRIKMARKLRGKENTGCQLATWAAIKSIRRARHRRVKLKADGKWAKKLTYVIDKAGELSEEKLFAWLDKQEKEALKLFRDCGGPEKPPFDPKVDYQKAITYR